MMKKSFYSLALLLFFVTSLTAQSGKVERAKKNMKDLNYIGAIELLNSVLAKSPDDAEALINLAECYRKVSDSENAEFLYAKVVQLKESQPIHYLYYGEALQRNGKCDLAREWYQKFAEAAPEDVRGQYLNKACDFEQELKTKGEGVYELKRTPFNSNFDDFGTCFYKDGVIFASERDAGTAVKRNHCWTGNPFLDLYFVPFKNCGKDATFGRVEKFSNDINSKYHDAVPTFSGDESAIFFTRNNYNGKKAGANDEGIMLLKIYMAKKKGNGFGSEEELPFNSNEYSCAHPSINADGTRLYFASDMPGGFGGMDLYVSELENGRWGPPMNLGAGINTEGNEIFPHIHQSGRLYFSSDSHLGLGGLDVVYVDPKGEGQWSAPENMGAPINSKDDDFGLVLNKEGTCGFLSSDREGGSGRDDIYSFTRTATSIKVYVYDEATKKPIEGAKVTCDKCLKKEFTTDKEGKAMVDMKFNTCGNFEASADTYESNKKEGCVKDASIVETPVVEIPLSKKNKFELEVFVFEQLNNLPLSEATVTVSSDCEKDSAQTLITDNTGRLLFKIKPECCYKIKAEKKEYFSQTIAGDSLCTKGFKADTTLKAVITLQPATKKTDVTSTTGGNANQGGSPTQGTGQGSNPYTTGGSNPKNDGSTSTSTKLDPSLVYYNNDTRLYEKNGKPFTGNYGGAEYKNGKIVDKQGGSSVFAPSDTKYTTTTGGGNSSSSTVVDESPAYLLHIYYDFDQSYIRDESKPQLEKLLQLLKDNPNYIIELASHTDARGSNSYNNRLSQRRAEAVVRWLCDKGIERDRLVPRGYGESMPSNKCVNNIPCVEQEHQMNRRTEFRVIGCKGCLDPNAEKLSKPNQNTKVDKCHGCPF